MIIIGLKLEPIPEPPVGAKQGSIPDRFSAPVATRPDATDGSSVSGTPNLPGKVDGGAREMRPSPAVDTEPAVPPDDEQLWSDIAQAEFRRRRGSWLTSATFLAAASVCWLLVIRCALGSSDVAD